MAASLAAAEIVHLRGLLREMGCNTDKPTPLYVDNMGAMQLAKDMKSCQRSRHIERRYLRIREWVAEGQVDVRFVRTTNKVADMLTKPLDALTYARHKVKIMDTSVSPPPPLNSITHSSFDIEAAYLKVEFESGEIWHVRPPPGYRHTIRGIPVVWRLKSPLYGEVDAGRSWNRTLVKQLRDVQRFRQSQYDPCYFYKLSSSNERIDLLMYVDDGYAVSNSQTLTDQVLDTLHAKFKLARKGPEFFLGNNIRVLA